MKLNEKIYHCRRKAGLSQEALAEKIGVSRQAISKWETGEASPEISKLPLLAKTFGVTADWLLAEEDASGENAGEESTAQPEAPGGHPYAPGGGTTVNCVPDWVDKLPGFLGRLIRRYGWIIGVRIAISGALFTALGFVAKAMFGSMNDYASQQMGSLFGGGGVTAYDNAGNVMDLGALGLSAGDFGAMGGSSFGFTVPTDTSSILCNFIIGVGVVLLVGGAVLAWYLKKKGEKM